MKKLLEVLFQIKSCFLNRILGMYCLPCSQVPYIVHRKKHILDMMTPATSFVFLQAKASATLYHLAAFSKMFSKMELYARFYHYHDNFANLYTNNVVFVEKISAVDAWAEFLAKHGEHKFGKLVRFIPDSQGKHWNFWRWNYQSYAKLLGGEKIMLRLFQWFRIQRGSLRLIAKMFSMV